MTQSDDKFILISIGNEKRFVSEQQARLLMYLAEHNVLRSVLGVDGLRFYEVFITCKGNEHRAKVTVG